MSFLNNIKFQCWGFCLLLDLIKQKLKSQHFTICAFCFQYEFDSADICTREPNPINVFIIACPKVDSFIWDFDPRCRVSEETFRQKASNHEMTSDKYKNKAKFSTTFCRQKKLKKKLQLRSAPGQFLLWSQH